MCIRDSYYPLLQELSYIRPLRMLSPLAFANGAATDPFTHNSCPAGWGTVDATDTDPAVVCAGTLAVSGTGPFKLGAVTKANADTDEEYDERAQFLAHADYWGGAPDIEELHVVYYEDQDAVLAALQDESLDVVVGEFMFGYVLYSILYVIFFPFAFLPFDFIRRSFVHAKAHPSGTFDKHLHRPDAGPVDAAREQDLRAAAAVAAVFFDAATTAASASRGRMAYGSTMLGCLFYKFKI